MTEKEILLTSILDCSRATLYSREWSLNAEQAQRLSEALSLRSQGVPLQYILGETEFFGLEFRADKRALIPRPETEILVEAALRRIRQLSSKKDSRILDLGTGSGCIAVSLARHYPAIHIDGLDISPLALALAKENAVNNSVEERIDFFCSDLFSVFRENNSDYRPANYDIIISNPPYVRSGDIKGLQKELAYEPRMALDGGCDGLDFYRRVISEAGSFLKEKGLLLLEIGFGQREDIEKIVRAGNNFFVDEIIKDYSQIERVMIMRNYGKAGN